MKFPDRGVFSVFDAGRRCGRMWIPAAALFFIGCAATSELAPPPQDANATPEAVEGRRVYLTCSGSCHSPEPVGKYTRAEWLQKLVPEMSVEAKLTPARRSALEAYIN